MKPSKATCLLDANVLIALSVGDHLSHQLAVDWFEENEPRFATCPITEGALMRFLMRINPDAGAALAKEILTGFASHRKHEFWPDDLSYTKVPDRGLRGHKQVTDLYLVALAQARDAVVVTLDQSLAAWHPKVCRLISAS